MRVNANSGIISQAAASDAMLTTVIGRANRVERRFQSEKRGPAVAMITHLLLCAEATNWPNQRVLYAGFISRPGVLFERSRLFLRSLFEAPVF